MFLRNCPPLTFSLASTTGWLPVTFEPLICEEREGKRYTRRELQEKTSLYGPGEFMGFDFIYIILYLSYKHLGYLADAFIQSDLQYVHLSEERETIYRCRYSKDVHRTKCQALTIIRLTHFAYPTKITRTSCYTMLSTFLPTRLYNIQ